jgi:hypothetical protein
VRAGRAALNSGEEDRTGSGTWGFLGFSGKFRSVFDFDSGGQLSIVVLDFLYKVYKKIKTLYASLNQKNMNGPLS